jgi:exodeoxyribonuclease VII large subunit
MRILDVLEVTAYIKELVEFDPVLNDVWVRGEISNLTTSAAGHSYFSLAGDGVQLNCVLFRGSRARLMAHPVNGEAVLAHGRFSIYETRGQYQLIVDNVAPEGMGILQLQFEDTKRRLAEEGLFALDRKRELPEMPRVIGVVTSEQGSVWHDIQHVVARRFPLTRLIIAPSTVQGQNAPRELIRGLEALQADADPDVIIIGRGGGSAEDLACFSDEGLARAIFRCRVPVVSAVGHETDTCIADLVADVRAPTPSAAAELCVPDRRALLETVDQYALGARGLALQALTEKRVELRALQATIRFSSPNPRVSRFQQDVDMQLQLATSFVNRAAAAANDQLARYRDRAALLNPREVLRRGYAVISTLDGGDRRRIVSARDASALERLSVTFSDGAIVVRPVQESP